MIKWKNIYITRIFCTNTSLVLDDSFLLNPASYILLIIYGLRWIGNFVGMILLDLQKVFDTVDHSILSMKLQALGLNELSVRWFSSYLSGRHQLVDISGTFSTH